MFKDCTERLAATVVGSNQIKTLDNVHKASLCVVA